MPKQRSVAARNANLDSFETVVGTSPKLQIRTGSAPADCASASTGTLLDEITLPSDWLAAAASGSKSKLGTWSAASVASGTVGHYRLFDNAGTTCHEQGTAGVAVALTTNALTAANGNVLNFASTTGVVVGMGVTGTGIPTDTPVTVVAVTSTTVTISRTSTAGVANGASITFSPDLVLDSATITSPQAVTINTWTMIAGGA